MTAEGVGSFERSPGTVLGRRLTWLPPRPMTGSIALPPQPVVVEGRRLLWRDTSLALIGIALVGALVLSAVGGSTAGRPVTAPAQAAAATTAPLGGESPAPSVAWPISLP